MNVHAARSMVRAFGVTLSAVIVIAAIAACGRGDDASAPGGNASTGSPAQAAAAPRIAATVGMVGDIVRNVAAGRAEVAVLLGPGVDPHLYKPTRSDVQRLMEADVIFYNGLLLEGKMTDTLIRAATSGKKVFAVTELLDEADLLRPDGVDGLYDPHVWMDPSAWSGTVAVVRDKLIEVDPSGREVYEANAAEYAASLAELMAYANDAVSRIPEGQRVLITAHDAFNYFGRRYGFEVIGIQGISTASEAAVRDVEQLVDLLVTRNVKAVFVESTVPVRAVEALIAGAAARGHTVTIGGELFSDAMGDDGTYEGTYIGMIDHNVTTIARALGGEPPAGGMQGKLND